MRRQRPVFTAVEREARDSDRVMVDYEGRIDGKPFEGGEGRDISVIIGTRQSMPELEQGVKGARAGENRTISVTFAAEHPNKAVAGRTAELHLTIKRRSEEHTSELQSRSDLVCRLLLEKKKKKQHRKRDVVIKRTTQATRRS